MAEDFEKWEIAVAKNVVNKFLGTNKIKGYDFDDLLQECLLHWYQKRGKYRECKGTTKKTFMGKILKRRLQEVLRDQSTDKRKINLLTEPLVIAPDDSELDGDSFDVSDKKQKKDFDLSQHYIAMESDVASVISKLPSVQKKMCHLIMEGYSMAHISRILNKPRATLYDEIKRIQKIFLDHRLNEYLE